ncbi:MAG TPA: hypothetical protein ENK11_10370 [Phycisphaerales bacterium]|nr:hypothetical protein [Phycisphaerales bacterium]
MMAHTASERRPGRLAPLIAANAALLGVLAFVEFGPAAFAQQGGQPARPRGQYTLVGGQIQTGNSNAVYIVDSVNQEMIVLRWEDGRNILSGIGYRDLENDGKARSKR